MIFHQTPIPGVHLIEPVLREDERGFFARVFCAEEFHAQGLETAVVQCSVSQNRLAGTLRGMHYQTAPYEETRLVRCTAGAVYDVALDLRRDSPTFLAWHAIELTARNHLALYIPAGCAHGFLTLEDDSEVVYLMSEFYHPECARGVRWDDPAFQITWPRQPAVISDRDRNYEFFSSAQ